jgi:hypothetical protein
MKPITLPDGTLLPPGYSIVPSEEQIDGKPRGLHIRRDGKPFDFVVGSGTPPMEAPRPDNENCAQVAWCNYYGRLADRINDKRPEREQILAWRTSDESVYEPYCLDHYVPSEELEQITLVGNWDELRDMICSGCGTPAIDDGILYKYGLNNSYGDDDDEEDEDGEDEL